MKTCSKCGGIKPKTEFSNHSRKRDGLNSSCKACANAAGAAYYAANTDKVKARNAAWNSANPEKAKENSAAYRAANSKKVKASAAARYAANSEKVNAKNAAWRAANPEACRIIKQNRRARIRGDGGTLSKGLAERLFKLQRGKCACCGKPLGDDCHLDHIMPISLGGKNEDSNVQLLRSTCNLQKKARHPIDFMQSRGFLL